MKSRYQASIYFSSIEINCLTFIVNIMIQIDYYDIITFIFVLVKIYLMNINRSAFIVLVCLLICIIPTICFKLDTHNPAI